MDKKREEKRVKFKKKEHKNINRFPTISFKIGKYLPIYQVQRQSSCENLATKVPSRKNPEEYVKTRKGVRRLFPSKKKIRVQTGVYSLAENVNFEKIVGYGFKSKCLKERLSGRIG